MFKHQRQAPSPKVTGYLVLEKKIYKWFLPYMGVAAILVTIWTNFRSCLRFVIVVFPGHTHLLFSIWNLSLIGTVILEEKMFENVDGRATVYYNSPMSVRLRSAKTKPVVVRTLSPEFSGSARDVNSCRSRVLGCAPV